MKIAKKTRFLSFLLLFALLIAFVPAPRALAAETSGVCGKDGDNLTWSYADGVLAISGAGEMADYEDEEDVPWSDVRENIKQIQLPEELKNIGDYAFYGCDNLTLTVEHGTYAEQYCKDNRLNYRYPDRLDWFHGWLRG